MIDGSAFLALVAGVVAFGILGVSGVGHVRKNDDFESALESHRLWPNFLIPAIARVTTAGELALGAGGLVVVIASGPTSRVWGLFHAGAFGLYVMFVVYGVVLIKLRPNASCGCVGEDVSVSKWTVGRAAILLLAVSSSWWGVSSPMLSAGANVSAVVLAAGAFFLGKLIALPAAMAHEQLMT